MILSYLIVQLHCYNINLTSNKILIFLRHAAVFYVPTFFIISYYFSYNILFKKNILKMKLRLIRILIPYFLWPILFLLLNNIYKNKYKITIRDLFVQLLTGKRIHIVFWFQCTLILTFIYICIIILIIKNNYLFIVQIIGISGYLYQCIHFYNHLFNNSLHEISYLIHNFHKVLFYAAIGITLSFLVDKTSLIFHKKKTLFFSCFFLYLIKDFYLIQQQFYYLICVINGICGSCLFLIFLEMPLENINNRLNLTIIQITNYTGGIYYIHTKVWEILKNKLIIIKKRTLSGCILIYFISYFICFLGTKVFGKTRLKYLFN